jgi:hypothetical protein
MGNFRLKAAILAKGVNMKTSIFFRSVLAVCFFLFTAAANCYYNPDDAEDTGALMRAWGVKYARLPRDREYVTDHGPMVLLRTGGVAWDSPNSAPDTYPETEFMTSHWTNFVDLYPANNHKAGNKWITWFNKVKDDPNRYTAFFGLVEQWGYRLLLRRTGICLRHIAQTGEEEIYPDFCHGTVGHAHLCPG